MTFSHLISELQTSLPSFDTFRTISSWHQRPDASPTPGFSTLWQVRCPNVTEFQNDYGWNPTSFSSSELARQVPRSCVAPGTAAAPVFNSQQGPSPHPENPRTEHGHQ